MKKLKAAAEAAKPALIDTLRGMVMIETGSADLEGLAKIATHRGAAEGARRQDRAPQDGGGPGAES